MSDDEDLYEFYLCIRRQICECEGGLENYRRCFSFLEEETAQWLLEQANKCNLGKITNYHEMVVKGCSVTNEEFHPCYVELVKKLQEKSIELNKRLMKTGETIALESARICVMPNFSMCIDNPEDCL
ncbi:hypothetical protein X975_15168, partial [Stegodyphus mimosarum]